MKNIKLDCFNKNDFCQITSVEKSFLISSPIEREFILQIFNHGTNECTVKMRPINFSLNNDLKIANLTITTDGKILFQDDLSIFFAKEIILGSIAKKSSANYFFSIDLLSLVLEEKKLDFDFDLLFDFNCEDITKSFSEINNSPEISEHEIKKASVLSASSSVKTEVVPSNTFLKSSFFIFLLSSLFVIIFFVIMKFINGQKKKKQT